MTDYRLLDHVMNPLNPSGLLLINKERNPPQHGINQSSARHVCLHLALEESSKKEITLADGFKEDCPLRRSN